MENDSARRGRGSPAVRSRATEGCGSQAGRLAAPDAGDEAMPGWGLHTSLINEYHLFEMMVRLCLDPPLS